MHVVIADDSGLLRDALTRILTDADTDVRAAVGDAEALLEAVERHRPDVAIIDIRMPRHSPTNSYTGLTNSSGTSRSL